MSVEGPETDLERTLHERFGLEQFRPGQREVIEQVLAGRDVLCVMPTGGGKSLCYQLPAVVLPGVTLVVSPLIALMKDQVDALTARGLRATLINSTLDPSEQRARILEVGAGRYDLVYVAPERFRSGHFVETMARLRPALLAVDEAHCISEWGHDFRPDYARIGLARKKLGSPPCIALTATATDIVRRDIADQLDLHDPAQFVTGFDRPNLTYAATQTRRELEKLAAVAKVLEESPGSSIIYASSRARCEDVATYVRGELRRTAVVYHAGLTREERHEAQDRFMRGEAEVVVATNAFGMGVDKPDIRSVVHYNMPGTLEAYYQEAGRAGRDGLPARCTLLFATGDRILQERFIDNAYPPPDVVFQVYNFLRRVEADPIELTQAEIRAETGIDLAESAVGTALKLLEGAGAIERFLPRENMAIVRINADGEDAPGNFVDRLGPQANVQRIVLLGVEGLVNRRYCEPVYFQPDEFAAQLGLDRMALTRALRALAAELPIDYVPPFRGNAIRVIDSSRPPRDLRIDFGALEDRKRREYDKLDRMVKYAQATRCRRSFLLGYFGDVEAEKVHCGRCDNCGPAGVTPADVPAIDTDAGREVILKLLSGVARAKGRFGKTMVAQMLKGSASEKMDRWGLRKLSTFGILPDFTQPELSTLVDALAAAGYVECPEVDRFRPVVNLTVTGWDWLKERPERPIPLDVPAELAQKVRFGGLERITPRATAASTRPAPDAGEEPSDEGPLLDRLRALRTAWAREAKHPPYTVFTDQTMHELVRLRPRSPQALAAVKGMGPHRLERYGTALLEAIAQSPEPEVNESPDLDAEPVAPATAARLTTAPTPAPRAVPKPATSAPVPAAKSSAYVPTEEWTWRLLDRGFSPDEAAAIRGLERSAIVRHAALVARQGRPVNPSTFLDPETVTRWDAWRLDRGDEGPPDDLPNGDDLWALFVACRRDPRP